MPAAASEKAKRPSIDSLTGARFVAAVMVVCYHYVSFPNGPNWINNLMACGFVGVPFFFVLSGFILAYNYVHVDASHIVHDRLRNRRGFWIARLARIYPAYFIALLLDVPFFLHDLHDNLSIVGGHFIIDVLVISLFVVTLLQNLVLVAPIQTALNGPAWTLSVEAVFYALFPWLGTLFSDTGVTTSILILAGALTWFSILPALVFPHLSQQGSFLGMHGPLTWNRYPIYLLPMFLVGMATCRLYLTASTSMIRRAMPAASVVLVILLFACLVMDVPRKVGSQQTVLMTAIFASLIFTLAFNVGPVSAFLSTSPLLLLGEASYAVYILQAPVCGYVQQLYTKVLHRYDSPEHDLMIVVAVIGVAIVIHTTFERPARLLIQQTFNRPVLPRQSAQL